MKILIFSLILFSFQSFASSVLTQINWDEIEEGVSLQLNENIVFESGLAITENEWITITEAGALALPGAALYYIEASRWDCKDSNAQADLILMTPKNTVGSGRNEIGVIYNSDCTIGIYIETKDIYSPSLFKGERE